ncbi:MAG: hypothetical protein AB8G05_08780 [Oligoflexales bacterium]
MALLFFNAKKKVLSEQIAEFIIPIFSGLNDACKKLMLLLRKCLDVLLLKFGATRTDLKPWQFASIAKFNL